MSIPQLWEFLGRTVTLTFVVYPPNPSTRGELAYDDETAKEELEAAERKSLMDTLTNWNFWCRELQARPRRDDDDRHLPGH